MDAIALARDAERRLLCRDLTYDHFLAELDALRVIITDDGEFRVQPGGWDEPAPPRRRPRKQRVKEASHGTRSQYTGGCRCGECTRANATYQRERKQSQKAVRLVRREEPVIQTITGPNWSVMRMVTHRLSRD